MFSAGNSQIPSSIEHKIPFKHMLKSIPSFQALKHMLNFMYVLLVLTGMKFALIAFTEHDAEHVPEKLPSMVAVLSPPSNTSKESQFCSVTKLITCI